MLNPISTSRNEHGEHRDGVQSRPRSSFESFRKKKRKRRKYKSEPAVQGEMQKKTQLLIEHLPPHMRWHDVLQLLLDYPPTNALLYVIRRIDVRMMHKSTTAIVECTSEKGRLDLEEILRGKRLVEVKKAVYIRAADLSPLQSDCIAVPQHKSHVTWNVYTCMVYQLSDI